MSPHFVALRYVVVAAALATASWLLGHAQTAVAQTRTAVEYYYADWNHYFVTSDAEEIAALDGGAFGGLWQRTGQSFSVLAGPTGSALPACRFFSTTFEPKSSHFYTRYADECAQLRSGTSWRYEGIAFYLLPPDVYGYCPQGTDELYRLYNNGMGGAPNHRYTTNLLTVWQATGWSLEGYDWDHYTGAFACVPTTAVPWTSAEGLWHGLASERWSLDVGIVLDDEAFYFFFSLPGSSNIGLVYGNGTSVDGNFTSADARGPGFMGFAVPLAVNATYRAHSTLQGFISTGNGGTGFAANYIAAYDQPASLAAAAGSYSGSGLSSGGVAAVVLTVNEDGVVSGTSPGCSFGGAALPRGTVNVYNLSLTSHNLGCPFGMDTLKGIAYYDTASRTLHAAAVNAARTDALVFVGTQQ
jgi:hypothetical protein